MVMIDDNLVGSFWLFRGLVIFLNILNFTALTFLTQTQLQLMSNEDNGTTHP